MDSNDYRMHSRHFYRLLKEADRLDVRTNQSVRNNVKMYAYSYKTVPLKYWEN